MKKFFSLGFSMLLGFITLLGIVSNSKAIAAIITVTQDQRTIQAAIDAAADNDTVVVMEGRYTGRGNVNLDFRGKAITVRSRNPEDIACVCTTIIDAGGKGVIVRFINDEGDKSVFEGFTLISGDHSLSGRGIPGYFEFSAQARPTTRRLRLADGSSDDSQSAESTSQTESDQVIRKSIADAEHLSSTLIRKRDSSQDSISDPEKTFPWTFERLWDGRNPFHQPAPTTYYYGSGDVDGDGELTYLDVSVAQQMAGGQTEACPMADVDGNGLVDSTDVTLIDGAVHGENIPGWWNHLTTIEQRNAWVNKVLSIDQTNKHPYRYWFQCGSFAEQLYIRGAFKRTDLFSTYYGEGQTIFNIPLYRVDVAGEMYGHGINAILIGDDPLNFNDWRFIEPQTDYDIHPGSWNMPYNTEVNLCTFNTYGFGFLNIVIGFYVDENGGTLRTYRSDLITDRPVPLQREADNRPDLWNPRIVAHGEGMVIFERLREGLSPVTSIHISDLPFSDPPSAVPLLKISQYCRLLDIAKGPDGTVHLLWKGKDEYIPGVFYGRLNPVEKRVTPITRVSPGTRKVGMGRLVITDNGEVHVFWLEDKDNTSHTHESGIYWSQKTESGWQAEQNLTPEISMIFAWEEITKRNIIQYFFDVASVGNNIILAWTERVLTPQGGLTDEAKLFALHYNGGWSSPDLIETSTVRGVDLVSDSTGTIYLTYWLDDLQYSVSDEPEGRGTLLYRTSSDGLAWSEPEILDSSGEASSPRMAAAEEGELYCIWERNIDNHIVPAVKKYTDGLWSPMYILDYSPGFETWYPNVALLPDNRPVFTWSHRSPDRVTIRTLESSVFATFLADKTSGNAPLAVNFSDYSGFDITSRQWDFGDGEVSTEENPVHNYTIPGVYNVSLTVTTASGSDTKIIRDYITVKEVSIIQSAINNAEDGEVIVLPEGIYYETINFMGKAITIQSTNPNDPEVVAATIIDGYESGSVVTFNNYEGNASVLNGITIQNGKARGAREHGGGIYCYCSSPTITNCVITSNSALSKNSLFGYGIGGGIYCGLYSSPTIYRCSITGNYASDTGGIYCDYTSSASINDCLISGNYASNSGGGITLLSSASSVKNCIISNNISEDGGGLYCRNSPLITNCLISGNHASSSGGIHIKSNSTPLIMNCTITGNSAATDGGGMFFPYPAPYPVFTNCILWGNLPDEINGQIAITYSDIRGGFEGEGNIEADPLFVDPLIGNYALQPDSPCIDTGTDQDAPDDDIRGFPRPSGKGYDMGAYEYDSSPYSYILKLDPGWSMISLPVIPDDATIGTLFPEAEAVFRYTDRYVFMNVDEELQKGEGYWIFVPKACDSSIPGTPFDMYSIANVQPGWSMIGSCTKQSNVSVSNGMIRAVFGFENGYVFIGYGNDIGPLHPGEGYWINLSEQADITVQSQ